MRELQGDKLCRHVYFLSHFRYNFSSRFCSSLNQKRSISKCERRVFTILSKLESFHLLDPFQEIFSQFSFGLGLFTLSSLPLQASYSDKVHCNHSDLYGTRISFIFRHLKSIERAFYDALRYNVSFECNFPPGVVTRYKDLL